MLVAVLLIAASYLLGSIPVGLLLVRSRHKFDIREHGSGNIGTANVFRTSGPVTGLMVLATDLLKGALPILAARALDADPAVVVLAALAAVFGHSFSLFLGFAGGKSVATTAGALLALDPVSLGLGVCVYGLVLVISRYASVASLTATLFTLGVLVARGLAVENVVFAVVAAVLIFARHHSNIRRLLRGEELRLNFGSKRED